MKKRDVYASRGPVQADEIREGDPYELSQGRPIQCFPAGGRGSQATGAGYQALESDPAVEEVGIDTGYSPRSDVLRAPDVAVGNVPDRPGWVKGVPLLAVEYADTGQDEQQLAVKIRELLEAGTKLVWVVRLVGPRRVEVHEAGKEVWTAHPGDELRAPGILENPVPVAALFDRKVAREVAFRNQLQRRGYASLEAIQAEGEVAALRTSVLDVFDARGIAVDADARAALAAESDPRVLRRWLRQAATAQTAAEVLAVRPTA